VELNAGRKQKKKRSTKDKKLTTDMSGLTLAAAPIWTLSIASSFNHQPLFLIKYMMQH